jgi:hypothetical protein
VKQVAWRRVTAALVKLGCEVYGETDFAMHLHRGGTVVAVIRKIDPVPVGRQKKLVEIFGFELKDYLSALSGTGPSIEE